MSGKKVFVERRPQGDYAVRKAGSQRASTVEQTQSAAVEQARCMNSGSTILVERVRSTSGGKPDKWRKP